ncbi:MAG: hypothetical protein OXR68_01600 [Alphaproteobacteria bacterium]|nr:hypothetical protein [Alphaproteobacteria bacterium]MDD9919307.1 hypothetical protein [Alphaproteobacteria bacterium]
MIEQFAALYVNVLEPLGKALAVFVVIISILWLLIMINDAQKGKDFVTSTFNFMWKVVSGLAMGVCIALFGVFKFIGRVINIVFTVIRDFFVSRV